MNLDRIRETRKVEEQPNRMSIDEQKRLMSSIRDLIDSLPKKEETVSMNGDLDQAVVREEETSEFMSRGLRHQYGEELNDLVRELEQTVPANTENIKYAEMPVDDTSKNEIRARIASKSSLIESRLSKYRSVSEFESIVASADARFSEIMAMDDNSLESLDKIDNELSDLNYSLNVSIEAERDKMASSNDKARKISILNDFTNFLQNRYGKDWLALTPPDEEEKFISLYADVHDIPVDEAQKKVKESKEAAKKQILSENIDKLISFQKRLEDIYGTLWMLNAPIEEQNRYVELYAKTYSISLDEAKAKFDESKILAETEVQAENIEMLANYQNGLIHSYGKMWILELSLAEEDTFAKLYAEAHKTTFERAKELISQSKELAKRELQVENSEKLNMSNSESDKTQKDDNAYVPVQGEIISYYVRVGRDMLKEIYSTLSEDQPNRVQEFSRLYKALSECSKKSPTNVDEENDKLRELQTLYEEIEMFKAMGTEAPVVPSI